MVIISSDNDLRFLAQSHLWFDDGTFKVTLLDYKQQQNLHSFYFGVFMYCCLGKENSFTK